MRYLFTCLLAFILAQPVMAMNLPPLPDGYCTLDVNQDTTVLPYMHLTMQHAATLKALFAECGELQQSRHGRVTNLSHYGALFEQKDSLPPGTTPQGALSIIDTAFGLSGVTSAKAYNENAIIADITGSGRSNLKNLSPSLHAILIERPNVLIVASEQRHLGHRIQYAVAAVTALTVMDGKIVTLNLYAPNEAPDSFKKLAGIADSYIASMVAANQAAPAPEPIAAAPAAPTSTPSPAGQ